MSSARGGGGGGGGGGGFPRVAVTGVAMPPSARDAPRERGARHPTCGLMTVAYRRVAGVGWDKPGAPFPATSHRREDTIRGHTAGSAVIASGATDRRGGRNVGITHRHNVLDDALLTGNKECLITRAPYRFPGGRRPVDVGLKADSGLLGRPPGKLGGEPEVEAGAGDTHRRRLIGARGDHTGNAQFFTAPRCTTHWGRFCDQRPA